MRHNPLISSLQLNFSGHETFPLRQLWLGKAFSAVTTRTAALGQNLFNSPQSIIEFGVGKNMVAAIRHWALACDVIQETDSCYSPGLIGQYLFGSAALDPYMENPASSWLIHWLLAGEGRRSTTWYYLFNHIVVGEFDKPTIVAHLKDLLVSIPGARRVSDSTLSRDVDVCLRSYTEKQGKYNPEDICEHVLAPLGLISSTSGRFSFRIGPKPTLPDGVFLYALTSYWLRHCNEANTLSLEKVSQDHGSPGLTFKLDIDSVAERLSNIERLSGGVFTWSDTAGLGQIIRRESVIPEVFLPLAYRDIL